jgi:hypothetical protein
LHPFFDSADSLFALGHMIDTALVGDGSSMPVATAGTPGS